MFSFGGGGAVEEQPKVKKSSSKEKGSSKDKKPKEKSSKSLEKSHDDSAEGSSGRKKDKEKVSGEGGEGSSSKSGKSGKKKSSKHVSGHQASLIYAMVTRGRIILADYTAFKGNFADIGVKTLEELPQGNNKFSVVHGKYTLNFLIDEGLTYMVLCDEDIRKAMSFGFLERVKDDFSIRYAKKAARAPVLGLQKEYSPKLREHMQYIVDHPEEVDKFSKIQSQVDEVKGVMLQNIDKAMQRGEKLDTLQTKTELMKDQAAMFKSQGNQLEQKMWFENMKIKLLIFGGFGILALVAFISLFGSPFQ